MSFKKTVHATFIHLQTEKINELKSTIADLAYSAANETKSTAGDKHETALAHLQTAIRQANVQLQELNNQYNLLTSINYFTAGTISLGSLVRTNKNLLYVSAALGKITLEGKVIHALSQSSPLGIKLTGKKKGDSIELNGMLHEILDVI